MIDLAILALVLTVFGAAVINGALGYGFSSITVPIALFFVEARPLVAALVMIEVAINLYQLYLNRRSVGRVLPRVAPLLVGLVPGVAVGAVLLTAIAPAWIKVGTYAVLLPLVLSQAAGLRRPLRRERAAAVPLGMSVGILYATTTISGPPLALFFNNQGLTKGDFRAALAVVRSAEATFTLIVLLALGQVGPTSIELAAWMVPAVLIGAPIGQRLVNAVDAGLFRQICMSFDAAIVGLGLARALAAVGVAALAVYPAAAAVAGLSAYLLWVHLSTRGGANAPPVVGGQEVAS
ncbi:MAG TPA: sulfite exporter TauE/SafE family protein [Kofleriaceae bacterium]|nr:sulfite exporter TauE/SafE family protein [Kofleriaceae bacterium]